MSLLWRRFSTFQQGKKFLRSLEVTSQPLTWSVVWSIHRQYVCPSGSSLSDSSHQELNEQTEERIPGNDVVSPEFTNRNPRNLEKMALAYKNKGWSQSLTRKNYWHRLFVKRSHRYVSAWVEHVDGHVPVQASTKEWAIKKHLYSTNDVVARRNLGRVIAQRCLESGIEYMTCSLRHHELESEGNKAFYDAMVEGGISFEEPKSIGDFITKHDYFPDNI